MNGQPFEILSKVSTLLSDFERPWFVAGGWAIDLYLERVSRPHKDIEIAILRRDQLAFRKYLPNWEFNKVIPRVEGAMVPWKEGESLEVPVHEIHAYRSGGDPSTLEILLNESKGEEWRFRRNLQISLPLSMLGLESTSGIPYLGPEVVLLYKAKNPTVQDEADFNVVLKVLEGKRLMWLKKAIETCHPGHPWLEELA